MYKVKNLSKTYEKLKILENINIEFEKNKTTCILGPSGCGKTTLLNIITGLIKKYEGEVLGFSDKDISFIFQEDRLIEWKTVEKNIEIVLEDKIHNKKIRKENILKALTMVDMIKYKNYYPKHLSGGMRQRIAIARAIAYDSLLLIMDEPFKSLDIKSKGSIINNIFKGNNKIKNKTVILVTHDIEEALNISERIVILTAKPTKVKKIIDVRDYSNKSKLKSEIMNLFSEFNN